MITISHKIYLELPFVINLPDNSYPSKNGHSLILSNSHYAGISNKTFISQVGAFGELDAIKEHCKNNNLSLIKLRTTLQKNLFITLPFLVEASDEAIKSETKSTLVSKGVDQKELDHEAGRYISTLTQEETKQLRITTSAKIMARRHFPPELGYKFIDECNFFIEKYIEKFGDFFCQPISLHDVCTTTCGGIIHLTQLNGQNLKNGTLIGKFPPASKSKWQNHKEEKILELIQELELGKSPDQVKLLIMRAKNFIEKGAYRSAIIESAAALETRVASKIYEASLNIGKSHEEAELMLKKHQWFNQRCKQGLKETLGVSLPEINNKLWERVAGHRENLRNKVAHSTHEPEQKEAEAALKDFDAMIELVSSLKKQY